MSTAPLLRDAFPVFESRAYLNTGTFGPLPQVAHDAMTAQASKELAEGRSRLGYAQEVYALRDSIRGSLASMIGAEADEVSLARATTEGTNILVNAIDWRDGDEIIISDEEHHAFRTGLQKSGAKLVVAPVVGLSADQVLSNIKAAVTPRTRFIALSQVVWFNGQVLPCAEMADLGVPVILDAAQSAGAIDLDVKALKCDAMVFPGQKWLLGPDGTGGLYVRKDWAEELRIPTPSSYGHIIPAQGDDEPKPGAIRFDPGPITRPNLSGWRASLDLIESAGPDRNATAWALAEKLREALRQRGLLIEAPDPGNLVGFTCQGDPAQWVQKAEDAGVIIRTIPSRGTLRASVGWWNNQDDLDRLLTVLEGGL